MKVQPTTQQLIAMLYERLPELFDRPQRQSLRDVKPLTDEQIEKLCPQFEDPMRREMWSIGFKAAHNIKEKNT